MLIPFQPIQDLAIAEQIAEQLEQDRTIMSISNPQQLKGLFQQVKMAIGMRLHSLIMAIGSGCNSFALSYDPKVSQLMSALDLPGYELSKLPEEAEIISNTWLEQYRCQPTISQSQIQSLIDQASIHQQLLKKVIIDD